MCVSSIQAKVISFSQKFVDCQIFFTSFSLIKAIFLETFHISRVTHYTQCTVRYRLIKWRGKNIAVFFVVSLAQPMHLHSCWNIHTIWLLKSWWNTQLPRILFGIHLINHTYSTTMETEFDSGNYYRKLIQSNEFFIVATQRSSSLSLCVVFFSTASSLPLSALFVSLRASHNVNWTDAVPNARTNLNNKWSNTGKINGSSAFVMRHSLDTHGFVLCFGFRFIILFRCDASLHKNTLAHSHTHTQRCYILHTHFAIDDAVAILWPWTCMSAFEQCEQRIPSVSFSVGVE